MGFAEAAEQRTHEIVAGAHLPHQVGVGGGAMDRSAVDLHHMGLRALNVGPHSVQNIQQNAHIRDIGNILNSAFAADQQCCR